MVATSNSDTEGNSLSAAQEDLRRLISVHSNEAAERRRDLKAHLISVREKLASVDKSTAGSPAAEAFSRVVTEVADLRRRLAAAEVLARDAVEGAESSREEVATLLSEVESLRGREQEAVSTTTMSESTIDTLKVREKKLKAMLAKDRKQLKERERELEEVRRDSESRRGGAGRARRGALGGTQDAGRQLALRNGGARGAEGQVASGRSGAEGRAGGSRFLAHDAAAHQAHERHRDGARDGRGARKFRPASSV